MKIEILLERLSAPARRALSHANIETLEELAKHSKREIHGLHGIGKHAMAVIQATLDEHGLSLEDLD